MNDTEKQFENLVSGIRFDDVPDYNHREKLEQELLSILSRQSGRKRQPSRIWRIIMSNRITRIAAMVLITIALLGSLSFGTAHIVRKFIIGSVETDNHKGKFELDKDIYVQLGIGTEEKPRIVSARNVRFFFEDGQLKGTLRCDVRCWPKFKWRTQVELFDNSDKRLKYTAQVSENAGVTVKEYVSSFRRDIHFSLGQCGDDVHIQAFKVRLERVSEKTEITPEAWVETSKLEIVRGRIVGPDGKPISNAHIQIREERKPGQRGIAAPDVLTDRQGYYSFDGIRWPYRVGVLVYETSVSGQGYRYRYKRLNTVQQGGQTVDFKVAEFPTGSAILSGTAQRPDGQTVTEFTVHFRSKVDWEDYSTECLYQLGIKSKFITSDGKFEIAGVPAGVYDISIIPTTDDSLTTSDFVNRMDYVCELREGRRTEIDAENAEKKALYGRVLFEDGSPAIPDLPEYTTQVINWGHDYTAGLTVATVGEDGYFTALIRNKTLEPLRSGKAWLIVQITKVNILHEIQRGKRFPFELLSPERDKAGVLRITRPKVYYGRILYENGKPAVPETAPWPGSRVYVVLRYSPATSRRSGLTDELSDVDERGYFPAYLTDGQFEKIEDGQLKIEIYHPSYDQERVSYIIGAVPATMLSTDRNSVKGYRLPYDEMSSEFRNLRQQLESAERLKELWSALSTYSRSHAGKFPHSLTNLKSDDIEELLAWAAQSVEYIGGQETSSVPEPAGIAIAHDKALLEKARGTNVLFYDGHVEFCRTKKLERLGIIR